MTDKEPVEVKLDQTQLNGLIDALNNLVKVFAFSKIRTEQGTDKKARFLKVFGLRNSEIADLLGVSDQAVDQALTKTKKPRTPRKNE